MFLIRGDSSMDGALHAKVEPGTRRSEALPLIDFTRKILLRIVRHGKPLEDACIRLGLTWFRDRPEISMPLTPQIS